MSLVIKEWMAMRQQTGWPMKEPWKLHKGNHGSTEVTIPCSCTVTNSKSRYPVLSASSHIMFYEFHALWDWADYEPSICNLWSETCIVGLSILWTLNMWSLIRNMLCGIEKIMNQQYVISRQKHDVTKWSEWLVEYFGFCLEKVF